MCIVFFIVKLVKFSFLFFICYWFYILVNKNHHYADHVYRKVYYNGLVSVRLSVCPVTHQGAACDARQ